MGTMNPRIYGLIEDIMLYWEWVSGCVIGYNLVGLFSYKILIFLKLHMEFIMLYGWIVFQIDLNLAILLDFFYYYYKNVYS